MFYVIIGQSGSGKTTFVKKHLLKEPYEYCKFNVVCTKAANGKIALGKYGIGKRTEGTDTLAYNAIGAIKKTLLELKNQEVVLEGDRISNTAIFDYMLLLGVKVKLYLVVCSIKTSMERLKAEDSNITAKFVKTTRTKCRNLFLKYGHKYNGEVINTDRMEHE